MAVGFCVLSHSSKKWHWSLCGLQPIAAGVLQINLRGSAEWRQLLHCCSVLLMCEECASLAEGAIRSHYTRSVCCCPVGQQKLTSVPVPMHWFLIGSRRMALPELMEQLALAMPALAPVLTPSSGTAGLLWHSELSEESPIFLTAFCCISLTGSKALLFLSLLDVQSCSNFSRFTLP